MYPCHSAIYGTKKKCLAAWCTIIICHYDYNPVGCDLLGVFMHAFLNAACSLFESPTSTPALTTGGFRSATGSSKRTKVEQIYILLAYPISAFRFPHTSSSSFLVVFNSYHGFGVPMGAPTNNPSTIRKLPSTAPAESTLAVALCKMQYLHI